MNNQGLLETLAAALKSELESAAIYEEAASRAEGEVRDYFSRLASEEKLHFNWLLGYYREVEGGVVPDVNRALEGVMACEVVSEPFLRRIAESRWLTTAVSAAVLLEANALHFYRLKAEECISAGLVDFFQALADWEELHYRELLRIQADCEAYWFDVSKFRPFA